MATILQLFKKMHICINNKNEWMNKNETDQKKKKKKFLEGCDYCRIFWKVDDL